MIDHAQAGDVDAFWMAGGNFLETLPDEARSRRALVRPRLRIHHDLVLSSSMLVESDGDVVILPAATRYESPGGGTETSSERRIIFSPEIPGRRIGSARPEWWVFGEVMARVHPNRRNYIRFESAAAIREEIARAVPLYKGIETLGQKGDQVQWGGRILYEDGRFATGDRKAHFTPIKGVSAVLDDLPEGQDAGGPGVRPDRARGAFVVSTRRGKQFNSMVQRDVDPMTGAGRRDVLMSHEDAARLGLSEGDAIRLRSSAGTFDGRVKIASIKPENLEVHWPEGSALLSSAHIDPESMEPDYNAMVTVERKPG
jgi:anaerobic selenocysteine-containing dehydrogenase